jgi:hypothetical protein
MDRFHLIVLKNNWIRALISMKNSGGISLPPISNGEEALWKEDTTFWANLAICPTLVSKCRFVIISEEAVMPSHRRRRKGNKRQKRYRRRHRHRRK